MLNSAFSDFLNFSHSFSKSRDILSFPDHFCEIPENFLFFFFFFLKFFIKFSPKNRKIHWKRRMKWNEIFSFRQKFWRFFAEILRSERCKSMKIVQISKNAAKWVFGCYRSCRYSRERASQKLRVISFMFQWTPYLESYTFSAFAALTPPEVP